MRASKDLLFDEGCHFLYIYFSSVITYKTTHAQTHKLTNKIIEKERKNGQKENTKFGPSPTIIKTVEFLKEFTFFKQTQPSIFLLCRISHSPNLCKFRSFLLLPPPIKSETPNLKNVHKNKRMEKNRKKKDFFP